MKTLKKVLAIVLTLCSLTAILTVGAWATEFPADNNEAGNTNKTITTTFEPQPIYAGGSYTMKITDTYPGTSWFDFTLPPGMTYEYLGTDGYNYKLMIGSNVNPNTYSFEVTEHMDPTYKGIATLTVKAPTASISITGGQDTVDIGNSCVFQIDNPSLSDIRWEALSNGGTGTITNAGIFTGTAAGNVTIIAHAKNEVGTELTSLSRTVTVKAATVAATGVDIYYDGVPVTGNIELNVGSGLTLTAKVLPDGATNTNVTWTSSDSSKLSVNSANGQVWRNAAGNASVTVTTADGGYTDTVMFTDSVTPTPTPSNTFAISETALNLTAGSTRQLYTRLDGADTTSGTSWSSTDTSVATVVNGKVTAKSAGTATITALFDVGGTRYTAYSTVTVTGYYVQHQITYGNYSTFDGKNPMYFITNDIVTNFKGVAVDGYTLTDGTHYYATSSSDGHILVALNPAYVKMLSSASAHTIQIGSTNGIAQGYFKLYGTSYNIYGVKTGDESNPGLWAALCLMAFAGAAAIVIKRRKDLLA